MVRTCTLFQEIENSENLKEEIPLSGDQLEIMFIENIQC